MKTKSPVAGSSVRFSVRLLRSFRCVMPCSGDPTALARRVLEQTSLQGRRRTQPVTAVDAADLPRAPRHEVRLHARGLSTADDGDRVPAEEGAVADGAVGLASTGGRRRAPNAV